MISPMTPLLRAIEAWVPSADGSLLEFAGGLFGAATRLQAVSRGMCFGRAEGLPGRVWETGLPVLLTQLEGSSYRRSGAAEAGGLGWALAFPLKAADALVAVVVLYGARDDSVGGDPAAVELWGHDERVTADLGLLDACYLGSAQAIDAISRDASLPRGAGLPGLAWQRGEPVFMADLSQAQGFLRGAAAVPAGLRHGLALAFEPPAGGPGLHGQHVAALLGSRGRPIARRLEAWHFESPRGAMAMRWAFAGEGQMAAAAESPSAALRDAAVSGRPVFVEAGGAVALAAIPFAGDGGSVEVLALHL